MEDYYNTGFSLNSEGKITYWIFSFWNYSELKHVIKMWDICKIQFYLSPDRYLKLNVYNIV